MKKPMLARPVPGLAAFLQVHFQASLKMALQNSRSIRFANHQHRPAKQSRETIVQSREPPRLARPLEFTPTFLRMTECPLFSIDCHLIEAFLS